MLGKKRKKNASQLTFEGRIQEEIITKDISNAKEEEFRGAEENRCASHPSNFAVDIC